MTNEEQALRREEIKMLAMTDWRSAQAAAERFVADISREEVPERAAKVRSLVRRFAPQIKALGEDPEQYLVAQETDLMRADAYTNSAFRRTVA